MRYLLLGASGFIGKALVSRLKKDVENSELISWTGEHDISDVSIIEEITRLSPDVIIIAAGKSFVPESWTSPLEFYRVNLQGTLHIAEAARVTKAKIVFLSTFVYGEPYRLPIKETNSVKPFNPYASSKFIAEQVLKDYSRHFNVQVNVLRVFNVYGTGQRSDFLIPMLIEQYLTKGSITVKDLKPKRDYVHIDDLVSAIISATLSFDGFQVYNVASGKSYSVQEVIDIICTAGGKTAAVVNENISRTNEVMDTCADISKIKAKLNWEPGISFETGIRKLLE